LGSTFSHELRDPFVIKIEPLQKIYSLLRDRIGETNLSAECADNVTREFTDVSALSNYENTKAKRIVSLELVARSEDWKKSARVSFSDKWYFGGTKVSIDARDDVVTRLRSDLFDVLSGFRPWYWRINKIDLFLVLITVYGVLWLSLLTYVALFGSGKAPPSPTTRDSAIAQLSFIGFIGALIGGGIVANRFRSILFPHGTFLIGQEQDRFDTLDKWRWIIVSIIVGIIVPLLSVIWLPFSQLVRNL
jgi:hypothetical protein